MYIYIFISKSKYIHIRISAIKPFTYCSTILQHVSLIYYSNRLLLACKEFYKNLCSLLDVCCCCNTFLMQHILFYSKRSLSWQMLYETVQRTLTTDVWDPALTKCVDFHIILLQLVNGRLKWFPYSVSTNIQERCECQHFLPASSWYVKRQYMEQLCRKELCAQSYHKFKSATCHVQKKK